VRDARAFEMPNKIQPREYSKGGGIESIPRNSDDDPNLLNANRNDDGQWLNTTYDKPDNKWNRDSGFAFVVSKFSLFFLSLFFIGRVFLCQNTSTPASQISTNGIQFFRKRNILILIQRFRFPKNIEKYFQNI